MTDSDYMPQVGYGSLSFGATHADIVAQFGKPNDEVELADAAPWPDEVLQHVQDRTILTYRNDDDAYQEYTLYQGKLVSIALHNVKESLMFDGVDLFSDDRAAVVDHFAIAEGSFFVNNEDLWFAKSGILFSIPEYWGDDGDKVVTFRLSSYEKMQEDFSDWEELTDPKDI